jgi:hypothetical protein
MAGDIVHQFPDSDVARAGPRDRLVDKDGEIVRQEMVGKRRLIEAIGEIGAWERFLGIFGTVNACESERRGGVKGIGQAESAMVPVERCRHRIEAPLRLEGLTDLRKRTR